MEAVHLETDAELDEFFKLNTNRSEKDFRAALLQVPQKFSRAHWHIRRKMSHLPSTLKRNRTLSPWPQQLPGARFSIPCQSSKRAINALKTPGLPITGVPNIRINKIGPGGNALLFRKYFAMLLAMVQTAVLVRKPFKRHHSFQRLLADSAPISQ